MQRRTHKYYKKHKHTQFKDYWETHKHETKLHNIRNDIGQIPWLETTNRESNMIINRLNIGHVGLKQYLSKINQADSRNCPQCHIQENREHFLLHCQLYKNQRNSLKSELQKIGIKTEQFTLKTLLGGDKFDNLIQKKIIKLYLNL